LTSELLGIELDRNDFASASTEEIEKQRQLQVKLNELLTQQKQLENDILEINQKQAESIREKVAKIPVEFEVQGLADIEIPEITGNLEGLFKVPEGGADAFTERLKKLQTQADIFTSATSSAFQAMAGQISQSLSTNNAVIDAFIGSLISSLAQLAATFVANQIQNAIIGKANIATEQAKSNANAITVATSAAAALGPLGLPALPGLIASQLAIVNGAFAPLYAFAKGGPVPGFGNGDTVPAMLTPGEYVLTGRDQAFLSNFLQGSMSGISSSRTTDALELSTVLRGSDILLSVNRAGRNNKRFFGK